MKARISFCKSLLDDQEFIVTVYGKTRKELISVAYAMEKSDSIVVTNLFITDDQVPEKAES